MRKNNLPDTQNNIENFKICIFCDSNMTVILPHPENIRGKDEGNLKIFLLFFVIVVVVYAI